MKRTSITIRLGAAHDTVTVDGTTLDRTLMDRREKKALARWVGNALQYEGRLAQ